MNEVKEKLLGGVCDMQEMMPRQGRIFHGLDGGAVQLADRLIVEGAIMWWLCYQTQAVSTCLYDNSI